LPPAGLREDTPYDAEARYANKRSVTWTGYKVHLTESCDSDTPHLITHVDTTPAPVGDGERVAFIHEALATRDLAPSEHFLDAGYIDATLLVTSKAEHQIDLVGPVRPDTSWQGKTRQGYDLSAFTIDWQARTVSCPEGQSATNWTPRQDAWGNTAFYVRFPRPVCSVCPARALCTHDKVGVRVAFRPQAEHEAVQAARREQGSEEWCRRYARRAGIEGTLSQAVGAFGMRRCRYIGLAKTKLQHILAALAINVARLDAWWTRCPLAKTRISPFAALRPAA